jgi:hypothetical protein
MFRDSWNVMRSGATEQALRQMRTNYANESGTSEAMELGVAYLWLKEYAAAWEHFSNFNRQFPHHADCTYGMAGTAKWCLNEPEAAIHEWCDGLEVEFADWAGGMKVPLLLFFASVVKPRVYTRKEAETVLTKRVRDPRAQMWPGPLAEFVLDRIDENCLRELAYDEKHQEETMLNRWSADFFTGVKERSRGNVDRFRQSMERVGMTSWKEFDNQERIFLGKLWSEEFFLARHEAQSVAIANAE